MHRSSVHGSASFFSIFIQDSLRGEPVRMVTEKSKRKEFEIAA